MTSGLRTPLASWLRDGRDAARVRAAFRARPVMLRARDAAWRAIVPDFATCVGMARAGVPFQVAADRRYDRSGDPRRLAPALAAGKTIFLPQIHQVLPRLTRLIVALRTAFAGDRRDEASFLFMVEGRGRQGLGLHHDGDLDAFWLQLEGRRTVTLGPPVPRGTPQDLPDAVARVGRGWQTLDLAPGSLLYVPPRAPHEVVCYGRSLAVSLTWGARRRDRGTCGWDVVSGRVDAVPPVSRARLWTQVPGTGRRRGDGVEVLAAGARFALPAATWPVARWLSWMPSLPAPRGALAVAIDPLLRAGVLGPQDLPLRIVPDDPAALDGWRFA